MLLNCNLHLTLNSNSSAKYWNIVNNIISYIYIFLYIKLFTLSGVISGKIIKTYYQYSRLQYTAFMLLYKCITLSVYTVYIYCSHIFIHSNILMFEFGLYLMIVYEIIVHVPTVEKNTVYFK